MVPRTAYKEHMMIKYAEIAKRAFGEEYFAWAPLYMQIFNPETWKLSRMPEGGIPGEYFGKSRDYTGEANYLASLPRPRGKQDNVMNDAAIRRLRNAAKVYSAADDMYRREAMRRYAAGNTPQPKPFIDDRRGAKPIGAR